MTRSWLTTAKPVLIAALVAFLGAELADTANMLQLSTLHAAAIAGLAAGMRGLVASLTTPAKATARGVQRAARSLAKSASRVAGLQRDAAGITAEPIGRLHIGIYVQTAKAKTRRSDVEKWLPALRQQAHGFARIWGQLTPVITLHTGAPSSTVNFDDLRLVILDDADQANALGYHDETAAGPYARVFALDCEKYGQSVPACVSHELLEAIADLSCDRWVQAPDGRLWALEVCDPVENDTYTVGNGVELSNYVTPAFFDPHGHAPFDALGKLTRPFTMSAGGYGIVMDGGNVSQVYGKKLAGGTAWQAATKKTPLSRTARRLNRA